MELKTKIYIGLGCVGMILGGGAIGFGVSALANSNHTQITSSTVAETLSQANDLVTSRYHYTNVDKYKNSNMFNDWEIPLTEKSFILSFEGDILYGLDLTKAEITVADLQKVVTVELPEITVVANTIDENSFELYDEKSSVFNPISVSDYQEFAVAQKEKMADRVDMDTLHEQARKSVEQILKLTLPDDYEVVVLEEADA